MNISKFFRMINHSRMEFDDGGYPTRIRDKRHSRKSIIKNRLMFKRSASFPKSFCEEQISITMDDRSVFFSHLKVTNQQQHLGFPP